LRSYSVWLSPHVGYIPQRRDMSVFLVDGDKTGLIL
jgi:hypothetical protein